MALGLELSTKYASHEITVIGRVDHVVRCLIVIGP